MWSWRGLVRVWVSGALGEAIDAGEEAVADFIPEGFDVIHALVGSQS
jgi:hypothetical protein